MLPPSNENVNASGAAEIQALTGKVKVQFTHLLCGGAISELSER
jgi:hypothetical protein